MNPLKVEGEPCRHPRYVLDTEDRSVHCSTCGVVVDAFDVLLGEAEKFQRQEGFLFNARGQLAAVENELAEKRKTLRTLRKSVDNTNRKLNKLIARLKALQSKVDSAEAARAPPTEGDFQLSLAAAGVAERFSS